MLKGDEDGDVIVARRLLKNGVGLSEVVSFDAADFFGEENNFGALRGERGKVVHIGTDKSNGSGALRRELRVAGDEGDGDTRRGGIGMQAIRAVSEDGCVDSSDGDGQ